MKKFIFITVLTAALSTQALAQVSIGLQIGGNLSFSRIEEETGNNTTEEFDNDPRIGFVAGAVAEIPFGSSVSFRPELNFIQKGYKYENSETILGFTTKLENKVRLNYIEVPLNFVYNVPSAGGGNLFFGLGPTFAFGISGKSESTTSVSGTSDEKEEFDVKFDGNEDATDNDGHLKSLDFGLSAIAGYRSASNIFFNVGYTFGFSDIIPGDDDDSWKNSGITLKVGYFLNGAKKSSKTSGSSDTSTGAVNF